ncbi:MAG: hypothetical protein OXF88_04805 [Rhodobacteraceae bacterium]|nr:hypothetical protein [Paracoccaceae bacterium]MCY4140331.1 hypothetical protein [Paracoccaceae bacterium]
MGGIAPIEAPKSKDMRACHATSEGICQGLSGAIVSGSANFDVQMIMA